MVNAAAGFGDTLSSGFGLTHAFGYRGLTEWVRHQWNEAQGLPNLVDPDSYAYKAGQYSAWAYGLSVSAALTVESAAGAAAGNVVTNSVFRWGLRGTWQGGSGPHFHLFPAMKHHLPYEFKTWFYHSRAIIRGWFSP